MLEALRGRRATAWQDRNHHNQIISLPLAVTLDGIYYRHDALKELGSRSLTPDWDLDEFLSLRQASPGGQEKYGYGMRGGGPGRCSIRANSPTPTGAEVLKTASDDQFEGSVTRLAWYLDSALKHKSRRRVLRRRLRRNSSKPSARRHQHVPAQFRLERQSKGERRRQQFCHAALPIGPAKKRASFWFSETLTMFKGARNKEGAWQS